MRLKTITSLFAASVVLFHTAFAQTPNSQAGAGNNNATSIANSETTTSTAKTNWTVQFGSQHRFIENKGQYTGWDHLKNSEILFGVDYGDWQIYFTKKGVTYRFDKKTLKSEEEEWAERREEANRRAHEREREKERDHDEEEEEEHRLTIESDFVHMFWQGANPNVELVGEDEVADYNTFSMENKKTGDYYQIGDVKGYQKLVYKNVYPNIDVEYTFHPESGIEYTLKLRPGANLADVKMSYAKGGKISINDKGELYIVTSLGTAMEHPPVAYYADNKNNTVDAKFALKGRTVSFDLGSYDLSKTLVIDPWVQSPTLNYSNCVWECDHDSLGNIYAIGGEMPMKLMKYNSSGVLQWTYVTPWDTSNAWLGGMATDVVGNTYITRGSTAAIQKVNSAGTMVWSKSGSSNDEYWTIAFNFDQTKLFIGGTRLGLLPPANSFGVIFEISTTNGSVNNLDRVTSGSPSAFVILDEVRAITASYNSKYYYMSLDSMGIISEDFSALCNANLAQIFSNYNLAYKCETYRPDNGNAGICSIRASHDYVYTQNGVSLQQRSLLTLAAINSVTIPGGQSTTTLGASQVGNSGIDIDVCNNVFVGSADRLVEYDANLNQITSVATPYKIYDVTVSTGGDVVVCGGTGTSTTASRTGYLQSFHIPACNPHLLTSCDPTICPVGPFCNTDAPITLTTALSGGVFAGPGITNASTGVFDPSAAGPGTHTVTYTLPCGSDTIFVVVNSCATLTACSEQNGQYTVSGGTGPYTWQKGVPFTNCSACTFGICLPPLCNGFPDTTWTTYATTATATPPGTFPIRVKDSGVNVLLITSAGSIQPCVTCPNIVTNITSQTNASCSTATNGSVTVSADGGVAPYTYAWTPGNLTGATQSALGVGTYTIITTDSHGCHDTITATVAADPNIALTTSKTDPTCGQNNGSATVNTTAGTGPFTYAWSNTGTTQTISNLAAGTYTVTVTGAGGCTATTTATLTSSNAIVANVTVVDPTCGNNNGSATANTTAGTGPFTYAWSNTGTTQTINNLAPGTYTVTITGAGGCTATASGTLASSTAIAANVSVTNPTCGNNNGSATANTTAGTGPFTYVWSNTGTTQTINNLAAGGYTVTITGAGGCTATASGTLAASTAISATVTVVDPTCGNNNGSATVNAIGGSSPYTYAWSNTGTTQTINNLAAGTYTVTVTGTNGCTGTASGTLASSSAIVANVTVVDPTCGQNNGSATANVTAGTGPFTYLWSNTGNTQTISNLAAGTYTVTITGTGGCTGTASGTLATSTGIAANVSTTQSTCGTSNGSATANTTAGTGPFTYVWSNTGTTQTISNLAPGTYTVTITGAGGCTVSASGIVNSNSSLALSLTNPVDPTCAGNDGEITVNLSGGTAPYTITVDTGGTPVTINSPIAFTQTFSNLGAIVINVSVTDANGCSSAVTDTLVAPVALTTNVTVVDPTCGNNNGSATANVSTGTGPFTYAWSNTGTTQTITSLAPGAYTVTVTDAGGCTGTASNTLAPSTGITANVATTQSTCGSNNGSATANTTAGTGPFTYAWSNTGTTQTISNLAPGAYTVTVTGAGGCTATASGTVSSNSTLALALNNPVNPSCAGNDGEVTVDLSGGTTPYTITIDTGGTPIVINSPAAFNQTFSGLSAMTVNVSVTDANGCQTSASATLVAATGCCAFTYTAATTQPTCGQSDGSITITVANGSGNYTYAWANGVGSGNTASNLAAGTYSVTITDNGFVNCIKDTSITLTNPNAPVIGNTLITNVNCAGDTTGSAAVTVNGGNPPYTYVWTNGQTTNPAINLGAGTYNLTITDASGCVVFDTAVVTEPQPILVQVNSNPTGCTDPNSGSAVATVSGGTSPYGYLWSNNGTTDSIGGIAAGQYDVTVTDAVGCSAIGSTTVVGDTTPALDLGLDRTICEGDSIQLDAGSANAVWSTGFTGQSIMVHDAGQYWAVVTSGICSNSDTVTISVSKLPLTPELNITDTLICEGEPIILAVNDLGDLYTWSTGDTALQISVDSAGTYIVFAINGCGKDSATSNVTSENCNCILYMPNAFSPNGDNTNDTYGPVTECDTVEGFVFKIFDRWGSKVFESRDIKKGWDGTYKGSLCDPAVFIWSLSYLNHEKGNVKQYYRKGSVTLLR